MSRGIFNKIFGPKEKYYIEDEIDYHTNIIKAINCYNSIIKEIDDTIQKYNEVYAEEPTDGYSDYLKRKRLDHIERHFSSIITRQFVYEDGYGYMLQLGYIRCEDIEDYKNIITRKRNELENELKEQKTLNTN